MCEEEAELLKSPHLKPKPDLVDKLFAIFTLMHVSEAKLKRWAHKKNLKKLHEALEVPDFKLRIRVIIYLTILRDTSSLVHLKELLRDPFEEVLRYAANAIRTIEPNDPMIRAFEEAIRIKMNVRDLQEVSAQKKAERPTRAEELMSSPSLPDYEAIRSYEDQLKRRTRYERITSTIFGILLTIGLAVTLAIVAQKMEWIDWFG